MVIHIKVVDAWSAAALRCVQFEGLPNGRAFARVAGCPGAVVTGDNETEALEHLGSVLKDWVHLGMKLGDEIPVIDGIDRYSPIS